MLWCSYLEVHNSQKITYNNQEGWIKKMAELQREINETNLSI